MDSIEVVKDFLEKFKMISSVTYVSDLVDKKISCLQEVSCVSVQDLLDKEVVDLIKEQVSPKIKNCFKDAFKAADLLSDFEVKYCEGYLVLDGLPIEHAFNSINGSYFDLTREIGGKDDVRNNKYVLLKEYTALDALKIMATGKRNYYGGVFDKEFYINLGLDV